MLTKLVIRNFKQFDEVEIPLSNPAVLIGPNNSGKTTALQALALWELGLRRWREKQGSGSPAKRAGVVINRRDLLVVPGQSTKQLWRRTRVRDAGSNGLQSSQNIRIDILVSGNTNGKDWECGLEFDFTNDESFACRPLRTEDKKQPTRMAIPDEASELSIAFLPSMSGLASNEVRLDSGAINVRLGEGRTAEVLRNLCYSLAGNGGGGTESAEWTNLAADMKELFRVDLNLPVYIPERGEIQMTYRDQHGITLDLSSSGRGLQQTLLLLAYLAQHPGSALLLDEPDAHLEILRQREIYLKLREYARESGSQLIIASHSEVVLNEAASLDEQSVIAFLGKPHRISGNRTGALKSALSTVRFDQYYLAEQVGWVLYLENHTDLSILSAFARKLDHPAQTALQTPFLYPIGNQPNEARRHFDALSEAKKDLVGILIVDSDAPELQARAELQEMKWRRREIENYICQPETLELFAREIGRAAAGDRLWEKEGEDRAVRAMNDSVLYRIAPAAFQNRNDPWWSTMKASDEFLDLVFPDFYRRLGLFMGMRKADYFRLVQFVPDHLVSDEIRFALDKIHEVASRARPTAN